MVSKTKISTLHEIYLLHYERDKIEADNQITNKNYLKREDRIMDINLRLLKMWKIVNHNA